jgi:hypothetical protein
MSLARREFLASLGAATFMSRSTWASTASPADQRVEVRLVPTVGENDPDAFDSPICEEVRALVEPHLGIRKGGGSPLDDLRAVLSTRYGDGSCRRDRGQYSRHSNPGQTIHLDTPPKVTIRKVENPVKSSGSTSLEPSMCGHS